jgi:hypothetical protein
MKSAIVFGLIGLGFLLLVSSTVWTKLFPGTAVWTPEKAARSSEIKTRLHELSFIVHAPAARMHSGGDRGQLKAEYDQLMKENELLNADFKSAYDSPRTAAKNLKWAGIALLAIGVIGWYAVKQTS